MQTDDSVQKSEWNINSAVDFAFDENYSHNLADSIKLPVKYSGDVAVSFSADCKWKNMTYDFSSSYQFGGEMSDKEICKSADELKVENALSYSIDGFEVKTSLSLTSQIFDTKEDKLLESSFMSPGNISWSLGLQYSFDKYMKGSFALNLASAECVLFLNQAIYDAKETDEINGVLKGKFIYNMTGLDFSYNLRKKINSVLTVKNNGKFFFPGEGKFFSKEWVSYFKFQIDNEISCSMMKTVKISLKTRFTYNKNLTRTVKLYNKIAIGIVLR